MKKPFPLALFLTASVSAWAATCVFANGTAILGYLAFQTLTTGVFAAEFRRLSKLTHNRPATEQAQPVANATSKAA